MHGYLLDRKLTYAQLSDGYRTGIEPVLLAAFVPAAPGETVLEFGCGAGAGLLCLAERCKTVKAVGIEADALTAQLAHYNIQANHLQSRITIVQSRVPNIPNKLRQLAPGANGRFNHALGNPPWHPESHSKPRGMRRQLAMTMPDGGWADWINTLARWVLPGGSISLALPAAVVDLAINLLRSANFGSLLLFPLWPKQDRAAKIVLLRARLSGKGRFILHPGLILHEEDGRYTAGCNAVLREGKSLI